ncbi:MAG: hypothetical protein IID42_09605 [Planctomycetes bacterium]|nr:hypothetical protein [Planctomycetota bacterium]
MTNCVFTGNNATEGGGMFINRGGTTVTNCLFAGNSALGDGGLTGNGGGIRNSASNPTITSCTFSGNTAREGGGLRNDTSSHPLINNCIFWDNIAGETGNEIANAPGSTTTIGYRDIQGSLAGGSWDSSLGIDDGGNIDADPLFVDADGGDDTPGTDDDNLRLSAGSPAIDAGRSFGTQLDLDGNLRIIDDPATADTGLGFPAVIDMGAYEFGSPALCGKPGDLDGDGDVDIFDYALLQLVFTGPMAP